MSEMGETPEHGSEWDAVKENGSHQVHGMTLVRYGLYILLVLSLGIIGVAGYTALGTKALTSDKEIQTCRSYYANRRSTLDTQLTSAVADLHIVTVDGLEATATEDEAALADVVLRLPEDVKAVDEAKTALQVEQAYQDDLFSLPPDEVLDRCEQDRNSN